VGKAVGDGVGDCAGDFVANDVGDFVGDGVGDFVGDGVGLGVGTGTAMMLGQEVGGLYERSQTCSFIQSYDPVMRKYTPCLFLGTHPDPK
jgi:hypothetical protein